MITKGQISVPDFYKRYVKAVKDKELSPALRNNFKKFRKFLKEIPKDKRDYSYGPGKWTIRQLFQHLIDSERVFTFRALWFARKDPSPMPGFDENRWAEAVNPNKRKWRDMVKEYVALRESTILLFESFSDEELLAPGVANNNSMTAAGFGFVSAGHIEHHIKIMKTRYLAMTMEEAL